MAQQFQVLRCSFCRIFQVQQVKKSKKWNCKICNEKQSILKVFGQGSAFECRQHVQKLNLLLGEKEQASVEMSWRTEELEEGDNENTVAPLEERLDWQVSKTLEEEEVSRWNKYLNKSCEEEDKMLHPEKQTCSSLKNITEDPRKRNENSIDSADAQRAEEKRIPGFARKHRINLSGDTETHGNAANRSMGIVAVKELLAHDKVQKSNEHTDEANILTEKNNSSLLPGADLQMMLSKEAITIPSVHPLAFSRATGQYSSLFSTGEDFDDYL